MAIKFYTRDARDRAGREFAILDLLQRLRLNIAPHPVLLDRFATEPRLAPVVVQTWLPGDVSAAPPDSDTDWQRLLDHLRAVHAIQQEPAWAIPQAILTMTSAADSLQEIDIQVAKLPAAARPTELMALHALVHDRAWPT